MQRKFFYLIVFIVLVLLFIFYNKPNISNNTKIIEVKTVIKNHMFYPDMIKVPKNTKIRLIVDNNDNTVEEFESHDLHREKIILPNSSAVIILAPLQSGKYTFFGDFHQDTAQGTLLVE